MTTNETPTSEASTPTLSSLPRPPANVRVGGTFGDTEDEFLIINGVKVAVTKNPKKVNAAQKALYPADQRKQLNAEQKLKFFETCSTASQTKYALLNFQIEDPNTLEETYDLNMAITETNEHGIKYDIHSVFTIISFEADDSFTEVDLFRDYSLVTVEDVAHSNRFYATMTKDPDQNTIFCENLNLSYEYLANNSEPDLYSKVMEVYREYDVAEQGGPLYFKIMMDLLQDHSDDTADYIAKTVKAIRITSFDGESVDKVVSLIRGAVKRLSNLKTKTGTPALPTDLAEHLIKEVFTSSSVPAFNSLFTAIQTQSQILTMGSGGRSITYTVEEVLRFAETQYRKLCSTDSWTGVSNKASSSSFLANLADHKGKKPICFNCGKDHELKQCKEPKNTDRIAANKKAFWDKRNKEKSATKGKDKPKTGGGGTGGGSGSATDPKWAPPTEEEKKNNSRRMIDGKIHFYLYKKKRWYVDKRAAAHNAQETPNAATAATSSSTVSTVSVPTVNSTVSLTPQQLELLVANATQASANNFRNLLAQFNAGA